MKKIKTLFKRQFKNNEVCKVLNEVEQERLWVINGEGFATEKLDGTCCLIKEGQIYRRYDCKIGRKIPKGAIPCQNEADPITGHFPHWLICILGNKNSIYHLQAFERQPNLEDGTYELIGKHINNNPYNLDTDKLVKHGSTILNDVPRTYEGIKEYLNTHNIEGIVFYNENGDMCKIKKTDFRYNWNNKIFD
ncbi:MAG: DUF5565 family protein [Clostridia bacterium]